MQKIKMDSKWIGFIAIALVVTGGFAIRSAAESPAWHSYRNDKLGFQMEIPDTWVVQKDPTGIAVTFFPQRSDVNRGLSRGRLVILRSELKTKSIEDQAAVTQAPWNPYTRSNATIGGRRAIQLERTSTIPEADHPLVVQEIKYYVEAPVGYYNILISVDQNQRPAFDPLFARILKTLSFSK